MNTPIRTSYDFSLALQSQTEVFTRLWHEKLDVEREMASLINQGRDTEAEAAWDRIIEICGEIRRNRNPHTTH